MCAVLTDTLHDDSKSEELKSAASVALGGLTTGALDAYLPTLLSAAANQVTFDKLRDQTSSCLRTQTTSGQFRLSVGRRGQGFLLLRDTFMLPLQAGQKAQFLLLAALNEALTSLAAPGADPSRLSDTQRDQVPILRLRFAGI